MHFARRYRNASPTPICRPGFEAHSVSEPRSFAQRVVIWQRAHGRPDLQWQNTRDAYRIWVSEIMLQQTQVATVLLYYLLFAGAFPTVESPPAPPLGRGLEL